MLLAIDAGNTNIVFAVWDGTSWRGRWRLATQPDRTADEYAVWLTQLMGWAGLARTDITRAAIACVVPAALYNLRNLCKSWFGQDPLVARAAGLDRPGDFAMLLTSWRRAALVRVAREDVVAAHALDEAGVAREYERHRASFTLPEERRVQQIVLRTRAEADDVRATLASPPPGVTFYTLARDRSIVPNAAATLGVVGWVRRDQGHPALSAAAFALAPNEVSTPIETDAGFHVIRVLDVHPEELQPLDDQLRARIRARWDANRVAEWAQHLAETAYPVTLFPDTYASETLAGR